MAICHFRNLSKASCFHCKCAQCKIKNRPCVVKQNQDSRVVKATESPLCALQPYYRNLHLLVKPFSLCYACNIPLSCCCDTHIVDISAPIRDGCLQGSLPLDLPVRCKYRAEVIRHICPSPDFKWQGKTMLVQSANTLLYF